MKKVVYFILGCILAPQVVCYTQGRLILNNDAFIVIDNGGQVVVENPSPNAIEVIGTGGNIVSESENDILNWKLGTNTGNYVIPFTTVNAVKIPLELAIDVGGVSGAGVAFSTYRTATVTNTPYPSGVDNLAGCSGSDNSLNIVDRFWRVATLGYSVNPSVTLSISYDDGVAEMGNGNTIDEANLKAKRYNFSTNSWEVPQLMFGTADTFQNMVNGIVVSPDNFHSIWTLLDSASITIDCDSDGDGVTDNLEDLNGDGDPTNDDTDNDGIPENNFEYWKTGIFHFCVQDPDVEGLAEKIVAAGGKSACPNPVITTPAKSLTA